MFKLSVKVYKINKKNTWN